jgi:hypothetical protein
MPQLAKALWAGSAAVLVGGFACLGTATASADPNQPTPTNVLSASLSKGYNASNCNPTQADGVLASIDCGQNGDDNGPASASYLLFGSGGDLTNAFNATAASITQGNCGEVKSPTTWRQNSAAADPSGQVVCGTADGQAEVLWSTNAKGVLSIIRAPDGNTAALYKWWVTNG